MIRIEKIVCLSKSILLFLSILCIQVIGLGAVSLIVPDVGLDMNNNEKVMIVSCIICVMCMLWVALWYRMVEKDRVITRKKVALGDWVVSIGLGIGSCIFFSYLLGVLQQFIPESFIQQYKDTIDGFTKITPLVLLYVALLGPVAEEFIFRGMLLRQMSKSFSMNGAIFFQACLFAVYHLNLLQGIYALLMGIVLGKIYQKTKALQVTILTHIIFNSTTYVLQVILEHAGKHSNLISYIISALGAIIFLVALWYNRTSEKE